MFINSAFENELYDFLSLFGRDMFFYAETNDRIQGWETEISIIYKRKKDIIIRFKKELLKYMRDFIDEPFDDSNSGVWADVFRETYIKELPNRKIDYAISAFNSTHTFVQKKILSLDELQYLLNGDQLLPEEFSLVNEPTLFDSDCFWFPVGVDKIVTDFVNHPSIARTACIVSRFNGERYLGHIGYDKMFYHLSNFDTGDAPSDPVYGYSCASLDNFDCLRYPEHLRTSSPLYEASFFKDYIKTGNNLCYNYEGAFLEGKTLHHKNVSFINEIIKRFWNHKLPETKGSLRLVVTISDDIHTVTFDTIDYVIIPYMKSLSAVNDSALLCYEELKRVFLKAGITSNFTIEFKNIFNLNKSNLYGGSKRGFCGKRLVENIKALQQKMSKTDFRDTLSNEESLKSAILKLNK